MNPHHSKEENRTKNGCNVLDWCGIVLFCGVCSFGEQAQLLHPFQQQFNDESGARILRLCQFQQKKTRIAQVRIIHAPDIQNPKLSMSFNISHKTEIILPDYWFYLIPSIHTFLLFWVMCVFRVCLVWSNYRHLRGGYPLHYLQTKEREKIATNEVFLMCVLTTSQANSLCVSSIVFGDINENVCRSTSADSRICEFR